MQWSRLQEDPFGFETLERTMTPLRLQMIEVMCQAGLARNTQAAYLRAVRALARYFSRSPDQLTPEDVVTSQTQKSLGDREEPSHFRLLPKIRSQSQRRVARSGAPKVGSSHAVQGPAVGQHVHVRVPQTPTRSPRSRKNPIHRRPTDPNLLRDRRRPDPWRLERLYPVRMPH